MRRSFNAEDDESEEKDGGGKLRRLSKRAETRLVCKDIALTLLAREDPYYGLCGW